MTQDAIVFRCVANDVAEVVVTRAAACGANCASCEACVFQNELRTLAGNRIGARPGQRVLIESRSSAVYRAIAVVYVVPILLALAGCFLAYAAGAAEGVCILCTFLGIVLGGAFLVLYHRLHRDRDPITFEIIQVI